MFEAAELATNMRCPKCDATSDRIYCGPVINTSSEHIKKTGDLNMSDDLVKRLRDGGFLMVDDKSSIREYYLESEKLKGESANRIEKLEAALDRYRCNCVPGIDESVRKALEGKDD
jgi:hypothetical protein